MRNVYQEVIDEGNELIKNGGFKTLRRRTREFTPVVPVKSMHRTK